MRQNVEEEKKERKREKNQFNRPCDRLTCRSTHPVCNYAFAADLQCRKLIYLKGEKKMTAATASIPLNFNIYTWIKLFIFRLQQRKILKFVETVEMNENTRYGYEFILYLRNISHPKFRCARRYQNQKEKNNNTATITTVKWLIVERYLLLNYMKHVRREGEEEDSNETCGSNKHFSNNIVWLNQNQKKKWKRSFLPWWTVRLVRFCAII